MYVPTLQEDDVLEFASNYLTAKGYRILVSGGNQDGLYRYKLPSGQHKAPDLIAYKKPVLAVFEGKISSNKLFSNNKFEDSDYNSMSFLLDSKQAQNEIIKKVTFILNALGENLDFDFDFVGGLIAANNISQDKYNKIIDSKIVFLRVDTSNASLSVCNDKHGYFK